MFELFLYHFGLHRVNVWSEKSKDPKAGNTVMPNEPNMSFKMLSDFEND